MLTEPCGTNIRVGLQPTFKTHAMTHSRHNTPPGVRLMTDGGTEQPRVTRTVQADATVTRDVDGDEVEMLRVPISSTRSDREGDRFTKEALEDMADQIRGQQPHVFDNHGLAGGFMEAIPYDSREVIGSQMDADVEEADDGEHDLYAYVNPDGSHPEGERMLKQVRDEKQPIKFSVGFGILNADSITDDAGNEIGREFTQADLMETSRVGIPANPDASVTASVTSKDGGSQMPPGYAMLAQMMGGTMEASGTMPAAAKSGQPGVTDSESEGDDVESLRQEVTDLRETVEELTERLDDSTPATKDACEVDTDCPEGEVCLEGECVPEDEVGDDDEEESSANLEELREQVSKLESKLDDEGLGDPESKDTTTTDPDPTKEQTPDETNENDDEDERDRPKTATEVARGN